MKPGEDQKTESRDALKLLRAERATVVHVANERNQRRRAARRKIRDELSKEPKTVPQLAIACDLPTNEVLWHVAGMRKYGELVEDVQTGDYFKYRLLCATPAKGTAAKDEGE